MKKLKESYKKLCMEYVEIFCDKQWLYFDSWVNDRVGETAVCSGYYINFLDLVMDVDTDQPKGFYIEYYDYVLSGNNVNYSSYIKGVRYAWINEENKGKVLDILTEYDTYIHNNGLIHDKEGLSVNDFLVEKKII